MTATTQLPASTEQHHHPPPARTVDIAGLAPREVDILRRCIAPGLNDDELTLFLTVAQHLGLDPFQKQIHGIVRVVHDTQERRLSISPSIDGQRAIAAKSGLFAGVDPPEFRGEIEIGEGQIGPEECRVTVYRIVSGQRVPFVGVARWYESCPPPKSAFFWRQRPFGMMAKTAESEALRRAFPAGDTSVHAPPASIQPPAGQGYSAPASLPPAAPARPENTPDPTPPSDADAAAVQAGLTVLVEKWKAAEANTDKTMDDFLTWAGMVLRDEPERLRKPSAWTMLKIESCASYLAEEEEIPF